MNKSGIDKLLYDSITDDELRVSVGDLPSGRVAVIQKVLQGPYADTLMQRLDELRSGK